MWCVYKNCGMASGVAWAKWSNPLDERGGYELEYSEGQMYPWALWSKDAVVTFDSIFDAIKYYCHYRDDYYEKKLFKHLKESFPKKLKGVEYDLD